MDNLVSGTCEVREDMIGFFLRLRGCEGGCGTKTAGARTDRKELLGAERTGVPLRVEGM